MKKFCLLLIVSEFCFFAFSQEKYPLLIYSIRSDNSHLDCINDTILEELSLGIDSVFSDTANFHKLPFPFFTEDTVKFIWPLKLKEGNPDLPYHTVGPYFDLSSQPNKLIDFECGKRTYDGHNGTDIGFWPFTWKKMDEEYVEIISAADGIIAAKHDGDFDRRCGATSDIGNYVIIKNKDGSKCHYWHMKKGSLTSKPVGSSISAGEYIGKIGSSGNSSGPHLHFVVQSSNGNFIDPFIGTCNNTQQKWLNQRPYIDPTIHLVLTHLEGKGPEFPPCPNQEIPNVHKEFKPGELVLFSAYFHDQLPGDTVYYKIFRPDSSVFKKWEQIMQDTLQVSVWIWAWYMPKPALEGAWKFEASYYGKSVSTDFNIFTPNSVSDKVFDSKIVCYPNPAIKLLSIEGDVESEKKITVTLFNILGIQIQENTINVTNYRYKTHFNMEDLSVGMYFVTIRTENYRKIILVQKVE